MQKRNHARWWFTNHEGKIMSTILIGLAITAMIMGVSVTIAQCMVWYEKTIASWHHEVLQEEFAKGWDSAIEFMKRD
jgi:DMSO reductase anchor subunit